MKRRLTFRQLLPVALISAFVALVYALYRLFFHPVSTPEIIHITSADPGNDSLELKDDNGNSATIFRIRAGKKIQWVAPASIIKEIKNIYMKPGTHINVFSKLPHPTGTFLIWQGTIDSTAAYKDEEYNIDWIDLDDNPHTYDPYIQVKP